MFDKAADFLFLEGANKDADHPNGDFDRIDLSVATMPKRGPDTEDGKYAIYGKDVAVLEELCRENEMLLDFPLTIPSKTYDRNPFSRIISADSGAYSEQKIRTFAKDNVDIYASECYFIPSSSSATNKSRIRYYKEYKYHTITYQDEQGEWHTDQIIDMDVEERYFDNSDYFNVLDAVGLEHGVRCQWDPSTDSKWDPFEDASADIKKGGILDRKQVKRLFTNLDVVRKIVQGDVSIPKGGIEGTLVDNEVDKLNGEVVGESRKPLEIYSIYDNAHCNVEVLWTTQNEVEGDGLLLRCENPKISEGTEVELIFSCNISLRALDTKSEANSSSYHEKWYEVDVCYAYNHKFTFQKGGIIEIPGSIVETIRSKIVEIAKNACGFTEDITWIQSVSPGEEKYYTIKTNSNVLKFISAIITPNRKSS